MDNEVKLEYVENWLKDFCEDHCNSNWDFQYKPGIQMYTLYIEVIKNSEFQGNVWLSGFIDLNEINTLTDDEKHQLSGLARYLKRVKFKTKQPTTDHSYYNDKNGKDLFYHFKNGLMGTEMYKGFLVGNIFKYITRHGKKDKSKTIEDLKKARDYLNELIEFEEANIDETTED